VDIAKYVYKNHLELPKKKFFTPFGNFLGDENVVFSNGESWKQQRNVINPTFGKMSIFADPMAMKVDQFLRKVEERSNENNGSAISVCDDVQRLTFDVLGVCILGEDNKFLQGVDDGPLFWYKNILETNFRHPYLTSVLLRKFPFKPNRDIIRDTEKFNSYIKKLVENSSKNSNENLISLFSGAIDNKDMSYDTVRNNIAVFFLAGHETTSVSLQYCLYNLASNPQYQAKLRETIISQFPDDNLDYEQLKDFNGVNNLINETLRLFPPVASIPGRITTEDVEIEGWIIPKGISFFINILKIHHEKEIWGEDVEEFNPDRFDHLTPTQKKAFMPFGGGPRICLGMHFSLLEQKIFLIKLLKKYELIWDPEAKLEVSPSFLAPNPEKYLIKFKRIENQ